ncbi:DNA-3-methyladenine glycosylase [Kushneria marisflavi]|uniref:Putative 3-methyladenine DNA glycosylase n=1 Tax=Kushneria marisflavi TaxID=157779 RepID=A0A240UMD2_9GAMM|nr:DNA-3-methyladenine glycosylase [Kushneria marisflavi]ART62638.1 3-methyladenine DNA glycosylase [Kushneria marisflavi]RKD83973.1 DNA-3-methyladenine glycosylase [Kushneria marisflavi]
MSEVPAPVPLPRSFYRQPTLEVARQLLGCHLIVDDGQERLIGRITETEAYLGLVDTACHSSHGRTQRTEVMFGPPGYAYVYIIYGIYDMLNLVTEVEDDPCAVLIRAIEPVQGEETMVARRNGKRGREMLNGPGKLTRAMGITKTTFNRCDVCSGEGLWIESGTPVSEEDIIRSPRIGIDYAQPEHRDAPWRLRIATPQLRRQLEKRAARQGSTKG